MSNTYSISTEGVQLLDRWERARTNLERINRKRNAADCELSNATNALGKWMVPDVPDAMEEQFNIWVGNGLLSAKKVGQHDYKVEWRKKQVG
jgi:SLT domain-containing protein